MFSIGSGVKKDRGMGFSVLAAREMKREPKNERGGGEGRKPFFSSPPYPRSFSCAIFRAVSDSRPRSLTLNHKETLATLT